MKYATSPVYVARFFHVPEAGGASEYPFSRDFATREVSGADGPIAELLGRPVGNTQTVDADEGRSTIGTFELPMVDVGGEVLRYLSDPQVELDVELSAEGGETRVVARAPIDGYAERSTLEIGGERIRYTSKDLAARAFLGITRQVDGTALEPHPAGAIIHNGEQIRAGQRVQVHAGYTTLAFPRYLRFSKMEVSRRRLGQDGATFVITVGDIQRFLRRIIFTAATVDAPVVLAGNPITQMLQVLTSTGEGTNGPYDVLPAAQGLAVPQALIDVAGLEALRDEHFPTYQFTFSLTAPDDGKHFIEREILRVLNLYPFVTQDGTYSAKRYGVIAADNAVLALTEDDIIGGGWDGGEAKIFNRVRFSFDWDLAGAREKFSTQQVFTATTSKRRYGLRQPVDIQARGVRTTQSGVTIATTWATRFFDRFANPNGVLLLTVRYGQHVVDVGDVVTVTHRRIPNDAAGRRGVERKPFEVRDMRPLFGAEGKVLMTLIGAQTVTETLQTTAA